MPEADGATEVGQEIRFTASVDLNWVGQECESKMRKCVLEDVTVQTYVSGPVFRLSLLIVSLRSHHRCQPKPPNGEPKGLIPKPNGDGATITG